MDIWDMAEAGEGMGEAGASGASAKVAGDLHGDGDDSSTVLVVGDSGSGKSSLIQSFLKPNSTKVPKPTFALEYSFARRKNAGGDKGVGGGKTLAHIWELGGDIYEPKLLEVALTMDNLSSAAVIICVDLSKPQDCFASMKQWISTIRGHITNKYSGLKAGNNKQQAQANEMKDASMGAYGSVENPHDDAGKFRPSEVPICIMACKYDLFRTKYNSSDRRSLMQTLRFAAHYHGASLVVTSTSDSSGRDAFRAYMNRVSFGVAMKAVCEVSSERPCFVTAGKDAYAAILTGKGTGKRETGDEEGGKSASQFASSESDVASYFSSSGVNKDTWSRFESVLSSVFGAPDPRAGKGPALASGSDNQDHVDDSSNPAIEHPEADIDEARAARDRALEQYVADAARREKMAARSSLPEDSGNAASSGRGGDRDHDDTEVDERRRSRK